MTRPTDNSKKTAALNEKYFGCISEEKFVEGSPHLKHHELTARAISQARHLFEQVRQKRDCPAVLDMGAGEGTLTLPFLKMGATVTAADGTGALLDVLAVRAAEFKSRLTLARGDIFETLEQFHKTGWRFDIICASSFLHHIPDYLKLCGMSAHLIPPGGAFFTFQDPLRYDTLGKATYWFDRASYLRWRLSQGNYLRGIKTRLRRLKGVYRSDLAEDVTEYHVIRNGVDQESIRHLFETLGFTCEIQKYWSTQSTIFQRTGSKLGLLNTFAVIAAKRKDE